MAPSGSYAKRGGRSLCGAYKESFPPKFLIKRGIFLFSEREEEKGGMRMKEPSPSENPINHVRPPLRRRQQKFICRLLRRVVLNQSRSAILVKFRIKNFVAEPEKLKVFLAPHRSVLRSPIHPKGDGAKWRYR